MPTSSQDSSEQMLSFSLISSAKVNTPRLGRLVCQNIKIDTPAFLAPSSRGVVPHLSHDNLRDHTSIWAVYIALEDFIEKGVSTSPIYHENNTLRTFASHPTTSLQILGARRCPPVPTATNNNDHSITVLTSVGFQELKVNDYVSSVSQLKPDAVISIPDIPTNAPGKNRIPKMAYRTELWLDALLREVGGTTSVFAPVLPIEMEQQNLYIQSVVENKDEVTGLALYDSILAAELPDALNELPRLALDDPNSPHKVLSAIARGVDLFSIGFLSNATDAGIALEFVFPGEKAENGNLKRLGRDMWSMEYATDLSPFMEGCKCYACINHHRAFVQHLLSAREMTAWVLLQIHNTRTLEIFFAEVRNSIANGTFDADCKRFSEVYELELPEKTGEGPRLRGYQFNTGPGPRKNKKVFERFGGDMRQASEEAETPPDVDANSLEEKGFAERFVG